jgi:hypothetical protein
MGLHRDHFKTYSSGAFVTRDLTWLVRGYGLGVVESCFDKPDLQLLF